VFPHHENELAQSCCAFHEDRMANIWMHNGFLQVEGDKMSKSEGNFVTIRELLETDKFGGRRWPGEVLRLAMLKTHYRSPMDWTTKALEEAEKNLVRWFKAIVDTLGSDALRGDWPTLNPRQQLLYELQQDLNIPAIIAGLTSIARSISDPNYAGTKYGVEDAWTFVWDLSLLGLISRDRIGFVLDFVQGRTVSLAQSEYDQIEKFIADRTAARARKDFKESDRIRDELAAMGVVIKDSKEGTTWEIAR
jgi:cysteinyl-tRNA synthetase